MKIVPPVIFTLIVTAALPAAAQYSPLTRAKTGLTQRDTELLSSSIDRLNQSDQLAVGARDSWSNPATHSRGENKVTRIFEDNGRPCHTLHLEISVKGRKPPRVYNLNWCKVPEGSWKIVNSPAP